MRCMDENMMLMDIIVISVLGVSNMIFERSLHILFIIVTLVYT